MDNPTIFIEDCSNCQHSIMCGWRKMIIKEYENVDIPVTGYTKVNRVILDVTCKMKLPQK